MNEKFPEPGTVYYRPKFEPIVGPLLLHFLLSERLDDAQKVKALLVLHDFDKQRNSAEQEDGP